MNAFRLGPARMVVAICGLLIVWSYQKPSRTTAIESRSSFSTSSALGSNEGPSNLGNTPKKLINSINPRILQQTQVHVRQDVASLSAAQIASLQKGFAVMMQRSSDNPNDPTGLTYQANIHATEAAMVAMNFGTRAVCLMGDTGAAGWDQCQHGGYFFLSWHRMYLYFFERILRAASGDPSLALPYWNYESASERALPLSFLQPAADCGGNPNANPGCNPFYVFGRTMNGGGALGVGPSGVPSWDDSAAFSDTTFEPPVGFTGPSFGGPPSAPCHFHGEYGDLESQPHNIIHDQVGGKMADPGTAAQDPIFWLHHAEIDHLWKRWLAQGGGRSNPLSDTNWMGQSFTFYDETGQAVTLSDNGVLDTAAQLDYIYDDDPPPSSQPNPPTNLQVQVDSVSRARTREQLPPTPPEVIAVGSKTEIRLSNEAVQVQLKIPPKASEKLNQILRDRQHQHVIVLNLEGVQRVADTSGVYYEILLNLPPNQKPPFQSIHHIANLGLFLPLNSSVPTVSFDLTRPIGALREKKLWNDSEMTVSFFAVGLADAKTGQPLPVQPGVRVAIRNITVTAR